MLPDKVKHRSSRNCARPYSSDAIVYLYCLPKRDCPHDSTLYMCQDALRYSSQNQVLCLTGRFVLYMQYFVLAET